MTDYPDSGIPYPFYFNGEELPKWSSQWHLCQLGRHLNDFVDDPETGWSEFIGYRHIYHLQCRMDHVGSVESEDPAVFRICAQEVLRVILEHRSEVEESIGSNDQVDTSPKEVFGQIVEGLARMILLAQEHNCAFWTSGCEEDRLRVLKRMRVAALPIDHPEYQEPPHRRQRRDEQARRVGSQLAEISILTYCADLDEHLLEAIRRLPKSTS